jgi:hypothetical protein
MAARLWRLVSGAAVPLALQGFYLIGLRLAAGLGVGEVTNLSYAYLVAGALVTATASALALVSAAPLTRRGLDAEAAAGHVVHSSWISLALIGAAAGVFAVVGGRIVGAVLGDAYGGGVGRQVGRLVVELAPWMVAFVAFAGTYPLLFVMERASILVPLAIVAPALDVPVSLALRSAFGIAGVAAGMALAVFFVLAVLSAGISRRMLALTGWGLVRPAVVVGVTAVLAFGVLRLLVGPLGAAVGGLVLYAALLIAGARLGLGAAWSYVRALHAA